MSKLVDHYQNLYTCTIWAIGAYHVLKEPFVTALSLKVQLALVRDGFLRMANQFCYAANAVKKLAAKIGLHTSYCAWNASRISADRITTFRLKLVLFVCFVTLICMAPQG